MGCRGAAAAAGTGSGRMVTGRKPGVVPSEEGWFVIPSESNALFLTREHWNELGGYDPAFMTPGGGLANHDIWLRACADPAGRVILLLGEGTFHQIHGGVATNSTVSPWPLFHDEYLRLRGSAYERPTGERGFS